MSELREILDLPREVKKSDFVVRLTEGIAHPETLLRDYAVTADLRHDYARALALVESALRDRQSVGTYLHGSFGSGKSHFMAVLSLILSGDTAPWQEAEFHDVLAPHEWLKERKLLRLHFHMLGANNIEEKVFTEYVARIAELKPDAPVPPLFEDQPLFENAQALRQELGDDAFFKKLNAAGGERKGWGKMAPGAVWDGPSFDAARQSSHPDERSRLFSSLVKTLFPAFAQNRSGYVGFDVGLGVMCRHAASLGFDGIVLFLDELILWLASRAADRGWLNTEAAKIGKLVEAQDERREIPLISFIARQRDIGELVGEEAAGAQAQNLRDSFTWSSGRFDTIRLEDRNLPAIVEKRVVRKKSAEAQKRLNDAFDQMRRNLGAAWGTLLGEFGDEKAFRQVYPFTPALLEALVALSHYLQRERTALRILMEMLVDHLDDFSIGKVVSVGDLFDVLAGAEEPMDGTMRELFASAKRLYNNELLPLVRRTNGTDSRDKCQRLRDGHPLAIGCSNCIETRCRADNRLLKTLLLAALVPKCPVFRDMTASRLVQLNHGTLKSIVPGREAADAVARLRQYNTEVGKLRVGEQDDPSVSVVLEGVDLKPILEGAGRHLTESSRRAKLREIMGEQLDLPDASTADYTVTWRGMDRRGKAQFGNVRVMDDLTLAGEDEGDFRVVIDYPFDEPGHTPHEDEARVRAYLDMGKAASTIVWLPSFFGEKLDGDLGELVLIDEVLRDWKRYLENLRPEEQGTARRELENLGSAKLQRVRSALSSAYGVSMQAEGDLDPARSIERHFVALTPGMTIHPSLQANLRDAAMAAVHDLLEQRWPRHPKFDGRVTSGRLRKALDRFYEICQAEGQRIAIDKADRGDLQICEALGIATVTESSAALRLQVFQEAENRLRAEGVVTPTVARLKRAFDPDGLMGLTDDVSDFLVLTYAAATGHELQRGGSPITDPVPGKLPGDAELVKPRLPSAASWQRALELAGKLFGISVGGRALNARNLRALFDRLHDEWKKARNNRADEVADLLLRRTDFFAGDPPRLVTARKVTELLGHLAHSDPVDVVESLADLQPATSPEAMARQIRDASETARMLGDDLVFSTFGALRGRSDPEAARLLTEVRSVLEADQLVQDLAPRLRELALHAHGILRPATPPPAPPPPEEYKVVEEHRGEGVAALEADLNRIRGALSSTGTKLLFEWKVVRTKP